MDEDTGVEYFLTQSYEEQDDAIYRAVLGHRTQWSTKQLQDTAIFLLVMIMTLAPLILPVLKVAVADTFAALQ